MADEYRVSFRWQHRPQGGLTARLRRLAGQALARLDVGACEVGILLCDDATIRTLNRRFRHKDATTDVLSFPDGTSLPDGGRYLGDIAISLDTAGRQAEERGRALAREIEVLLLHALIHLSGYDHERDTGEMDRLEATLRKELLR